MTAFLLAVDVGGSSNSTAQVFSAVGSVVTALAVLVGALTIFLPILRSSKETVKKVEEVKKLTEETHVIVNQQKTDAARFNVALKQHNRALMLLLDNAHIPHEDLPIDQSLPVPGEPDPKPGQAPMGSTK